MGGLSPRAFSSRGEILHNSLLSLNDRNDPDMMELADIHCHLMPYVDDGAYDMDESAALLRIEAEQGVRTICLTPHLREGMFETPDDEIERRFEQMQELIREEALPLRIYHSREYHFDSLFRSRLEARQLRPLGEGSALLVEFGHRHEQSEMRAAVQLVQSAGYTPLLAHVERFAPIRDDPDFARELTERGALLQVNAGSILGREGLRQKLFCKKLLRQELVFAIGSDAHDLSVRQVELKACAEHITRKFGEETAKRLLCANPLAIMNL